MIGPGPDIVRQAQSIATRILTGDAQVQMSAHEEGQRLCRLLRRVGHKEAAAEYEQAFKQASEQP